MREIGMHKHIGQWLPKVKIATRDIVQTKILGEIDSVSLHDEISEEYNQIDD
jgi:hypothetical protein